MNREKIDNEHLESLEVFMKHHYITDNGHYRWVKKRFKELQQENKQLKSVLSEVREYILEKCPHSAVFRNEHIDKIYEIIKK